MIKCGIALIFGHALYWLARFIVSGKARKFLNALATGHIAILYRQPFSPMPKYKPPKQETDEFLEHCAEKIADLGKAGMINSQLR